MHALGWADSALATELRTIVLRQVYIMTFGKYFDYGFVCSLYLKVWLLVGYIQEKHQ